ncbi:hypothetical protein LXL04_012890 [Taraxacum kok-saghyz]
MQVTKGGCIGQTFALAKTNDSSGGKRSKRRSKEERKGMVETFIKRYQISNNGSFPSLHLTHKEVGGSYYIVREVFRELIQENRVLAPPKFHLGDQNMETLDSFLENYTLGSISFNPNNNIHQKDNQTLLDEYEFRLQKALNSRKISELHKRRLNGSTHNSMENEIFKDLRYDQGSLDNEVEEHKSERNTKGEKDDLVVETFPLRHVSSIYDVDEITNEKQVCNGDFELATGDSERLENTPYDEDKASSIPKLGCLSNESSEAAAIKKSETNPILSFIAQFMKFWSVKSFENSYIPENPRTPKPLTFSKNRLRGAKNRSNISPEPL